MTLFVGPPPKAGGDGRSPPGLIGAPLAKALSAISAAGLAADTIDAFSLETPRGAVAAVAPPPGEQVQEGEPVRVTVSSGYPRLAFDDGRSLIVAAREGEDGARRLPGGPGTSNTEPAWSPDLRWLAFRRGDAERGRIFRVNVATMSGIRPLTAPRNDDGRPAVSPDGRVVAFIRTTEKAGRLCLTRVSEQVGSAACLTASSPSLGRPTWSPDGKALLALALDDQRQVELMAFRSRRPSSPRRDDWSAGAFVTDGVAHGDREGDLVSSGAWSPHGRPRLAVLANWGATTAGTFRLFVGPVDRGGVPQKLSPVGAVFGCEVAWRPDGLVVAVANHVPCDRDTPGEIQVLELAEQEPRKLALPGKNPAWEPLELGN